MTFYYDIDVFEKCRNNSITNYGLCPNHYFSAQGLSWHAMLKMTKIKHELIPDPNRYILFEKGAKVKFLKFLRDHPFSTYVNFPKNYHFLPPDTHKYVCVSGSKKC